MPNDQDIRELCSRLIHAEEPKQFDAALDELKLALNEHARTAGNRNARMLQEMRKRKAAQE